MTLPAFPAAAEQGGVAAHGSIQWVSDYRDRGLSLSEGRPALQAELEAERAGWFAAGWASLSASGNAGSELDFAVGHRRRLGPLQVSLSAQAHLYNNAGDPRSLELVGEAGLPLGRGWAGVELAYAPRQSGSVHDNVYLGARLSVPIPDTPLSAQLRGGIEDGFYRRKLDWEAGLSAPLGPVTLSASLVGASCGVGPGRRRGQGVILALARSW